MKEFLIAEFGEKQGSKIFMLQQARLAHLAANIKGKSKTQIKTLTNTILPRIALYQVIIGLPMEQPKAYKIMEKYMYGVVCTKMGNQLRTFERLPFFYTIFRKIFISGTLRSDNWKAELIHSDAEFFTVHVHKCLWYDACIENNCPEMCRIFCTCDNVNFDPLKKVEFIRKGSIGLGQNLCDFTFKVRK